MFDINMYNLSDLANKVIYCNWRIGMLFNGTENYKLSHNHHIVNFISNHMVFFPTVTGEWATAKPTPCYYTRRISATSEFPGWAGYIQIKQLTTFIRPLTTG